MRFFSVMTAFCIVLGVFFLGCDSGGDSNNDDNDPTITAQFAASAAQGTEGDSPVTVTIQLSEPTTSSATIIYSYDGTAVRTQDFTLTPASPLTIPAGSSSVNLTLTILNDSTDETDETILLNLEGSSVIELGTQRAFTFTIHDND